MSLFLFITSSLYFFLPAYIANMMPVFVKKVPLLNKPISEKYFGKNKTWRGLVAATIAGGIIFIIQQLLYKAGFTQLALIDYTDFTPILGFLLGFGAITGDLIKSYYKRQAEIPPGQPWYGFDQVDFVIGAIISSFLIYVPQIETVIILLIVSPLLHLIVNYLGFQLGIRERKI